MAVAGWSWTGTADVTLIWRERERRGRRKEEGGGGGGGGGGGWGGNYLSERHCMHVHYVRISNHQKEKEKHQSMKGLKISIMAKEGMPWPEKARPQLPAWPGGGLAAFPVPCLLLLRALRASVSASQNLFDFRKSRASLKMPSCYLRKERSKRKVAFLPLEAWEEAPPHTHAAALSPLPAFLLHASSGKISPFLLPLCLRKEGPLLWKSNDKKSFGESSFVPLGLAFPTQNLWRPLALPALFLAFGLVPLLAALFSFPHYYPSLRQASPSLSPTSPCSSSMSDGGG